MKGPGHLLLPSGILAPSLALAPIACIFLISIALRINTLSTNLNYIAPLLFTININCYTVKLKCYAGRLVRHMMPTEELTVRMSDCCLQGIQPCKCKGEGHQWIDNQVLD
jgi:hypothetical protein